MSSPPRAEPLRSARFFDQRSQKAVARNGHMHALGLPKNALRSGKPVIGIARSDSDLNPCNAHTARLVDNIKAGIWEAGGVPLAFPTISLGETGMLPSTMMYRNLMSMDVEEMLRASPLDGVVLIGGCDKTTPAQLMGAASVDLPTIVVHGGPMLAGRFRGGTLGTGTDARRLADDARSGRIPVEEFLATEHCYARSAGHCMVMGSASTFACVTEAMGLSLPGSSTIPAAESDRAMSSHETGRRIVRLVDDDVRMSQFLTRSAFRNAAVVSAALAGSTNAVIHLLAIAGRAGTQLSLDDFDRWTRETPWLVNLRPAGEHYMEDFHHAGGVPALVSELLEHLDGAAATVSGATIAEIAQSADNWNPEVIRPRANPLGVGTGTAVLRGNIAPDGAVIKPAAASPRLLQHRGRALVFDSLSEYTAAAASPDLPVDENTVLVVRNMGPRGFPGMPETGNLPIPQALLDRGITDIVRISDARMSGTSYGTVVLHVSPEAAVAGPLSAVHTGDWITLDVPARRVHVEVDDEEWASRPRETSRRQPTVVRGYARLYIDHVMQAHEGADFDFLVGSSGTESVGDAAILGRDEFPPLVPHEDPLSTARSREG